MQKCKKVSAGRASIPVAAAKIRKGERKKEGDGPRERDTFPHLQQEDYATSRSRRREVCRSINTEELSSAAFMQRAMLTCVELPRKRYEPPALGNLACALPPLQHPQLKRETSYTYLIKSCLPVKAIPTTIIIRHVLLASLNLTTS